MLNERLNIILQNSSQINQHLLREQVQGYIYNTIKKDSIGDKIHRNKFSLFTYQMFPVGLAANNSEMIASQTGTWILRISSIYEKMLNIIENTALEEPLQIGDSTFQTLAVTREPFLESTEYHVDSVLIFDKQKRFLLAWENGYQQAVVTALKNRWEYYYQTEPPEVNIEFTQKPAVLAQYYKGRKLLTHSGPIHIDTTPEMLKFIQSIGLGHKASCGFGMVI